MKTFTNAKKGEERVSSVVCNKCGVTCFNKTGVNKETLNVSQKWGYNSDWDLEIHEFNLCQKCYKQLTGSFKHPVQITYYM